MPILFRARQFLKSAPRPGRRFVFFGFIFIAIGGVAIRRGWYLNGRRFLTSLVCLGDVPQRHHALQVVGQRMPKRHCFYFDQSSNSKLVKAVVTTYGVGEFGNRGA